MVVGNVLFLLSIQTPFHIEKEAFPVFLPFPSPPSCRLPLFPINAPVRIFSSEAYAVCVSGDFFLFIPVNSCLSFFPTLSHSQIRVVCVCARALSRRVVLFSDSYSSSPFSHFLSPQSGPPTSLSCLSSRPRDSPPPPFFFGRLRGTGLSTLWFRDRLLSLPHLYYIGFFSILFSFLCRSV